MNGGEVFVFLILGILVLGIVWWFNSQSRKAFQESARRVASRLSGEFTPGGWTDNDEISFRMRDRAAAVTFFRGSKNSPAWTRVGCEVRGRLRGNSPAARSASNL